MDIRSKDVLKQALIKYDGTLIVVSHDRDFLDGLTEKVYEFRDRKIKEHIGGIYDFLKKKKIDSLQELNRKAVVQTQAAAVAAAAATKSGKAAMKIPSNTASKENYLEKKDWDRQLRKATSLVAEVEERIGRIERETELTEHLLAVPEHLEEGEVEKMSEHYRHLQENLKDAMTQWEKLTKELENIQNVRQADINT